MPGTVLIILAGQFRGRRVVCLKQLEGGLLLVTGPYSVNGVPLKRVSQRYVIATSTKVDVKSVDVKNITDARFGREKSAKKERNVFDADAKKTPVTEEKKAE